MAEKFAVEVNDIKMEYIRFGQGEKNLVIIPGLSIKSVLSSADEIEAAYSCFTDKYTVYLFDRRKNPPENYTVYDMGEDTAKIIKEIKISKADFFGVSQGGMIALYLAACYPGIVNKLVAGSTASKTTVSGCEKINEWVRLAKNNKIKELYISFAENVYSEEFFEKYKDFILSGADSVTEEERLNFIRYALAIKGFSVYDKLEEIKCPVFIIGSEKDKIFKPSEQYETAGKIGCEIYMYENYSHGVYDEAPDYKERILKFLLK